MTPKQQAFAAIFQADLIRAIYEMEHLQRSATSFGIIWSADSTKKSLYDLLEQVVSREKDQD